MGEVVVSSEDMEVERDYSEMEKKRTETTENGTEKTMKTKEGCSLSGAITSWERFLPRMTMRILLVEADDSTRQIIAALLRKCSYRGLYIVFFCYLG